MPNKYRAIAHPSQDFAGAHSDFDAVEPARLWLTALGRSGYILEERGRGEWYEHLALDQSGHVIQRGPVHIEVAV